MGCCCSRASGDAASPYPAAASTLPPSSPPSPASFPSPRIPHPHAVPNLRPNAPLTHIDPADRAQLPSPGSAHAPWTRARLHRERRDWWDTRTTGSPEIWRALQLIVASLQRADVREAQALLDAVECTCPNGMLWKGVFDARGQLYVIPEWVVWEPAGLVEEEEVAGNNMDEDKREGEEEQQLSQRTKVRCRLSSSGRDVVVTIRRGDTVGALAAQVKAKAGIHPLASLRIVFAGSVYDAAQPLHSHPRWAYDSGLVLSALVLE